MPPCLAITIVVIIIIVGVVSSRSGSSSSINSRPGPAFYPILLLCASKLSPSKASRRWQQQQKQAQG